MPCLLCLMALLALCHLVWSPYFDCIFASLLTCSCMCLWLFVCVIKHHCYFWFHAGSHPSLYTKSRVPFRNCAWWHMCHLYSNIMDLRTPNPNPYLSPKDIFSFYLLVWLHVFSTFYLFTCSPCLLACLYVLQSSKCVWNILERLDPQFTNYQFKLNVKQLMCGIWTKA